MERTSECESDTLYRNIEKVEETKTSNKKENKLNYMYSFIGSVLGVFGVVILIKLLVYGYSSLKIWYTGVPEIPVDSVPSLKDYPLDKWAETVKRVKNN